MIYVDFFTRFMVFKKAFIIQIDNKNEHVINLHIKKKILNYIH